MKRVALTGGIATGKSYALRRLESLGIPTLDADRLAREAVQPGTAGWQAVRERFGQRVMDADGTIDRRRLAAIVFDDPAAREALEGIIHPEVYRQVRAWFAEEAARGAPVAIADIPLLFETGREREFDRVIVVACAPQVQLERLMARDGMDETEARQRIAAQSPIDEKVKRADYVIRTDGSFEETDRQVDIVAEKLGE
jgi:dephospho-CoA kinase